MAYNTKLRLIDAKMEQPSGQTLTLSGNTVFDVSSDGIPRYSTHPDFSGSTYSGGTTLVDKQYVDERVTGQFQEMVFDDDILVVLNDPNATFGKYSNGQTIPASGKTPSWVILDAVTEALDPQVNLSSTAIDVAYGESAKTVNVDYSYTIETPGASLDEFQLEWRRAGAAPAGTNNAWVDLIPTTSSPGTSPFVHNINDSSDRFNTDAVEYRLRVRDSSGGESITTHTRSMQSFGQGTATITLTPSTLNREKGLSGTTITSNINAVNQSLNRITQYQVQRQIDGGSYTNLGSAVPVSPASNNVNITPVDDDVAISVDSVRYRVVYTYEDGNTTTTTSGLVTFNYPNFATSSNITTLTKQPLVNMRTANNVEYSLVAETGGNKQKILISDDWLSERALVGIQVFNTASGNWEYPGASAAASLAVWSTSQVTRTIQGNTVDYTEYEHNSTDRGPVDIRLVF